MISARHIRLGTAALLGAACVGGVAGGLAGRARGVTAPAPQRGHALEQASALSGGGLAQASAANTGDDVARTARLVAPGVDPASGRVLLANLGKAHRTVYGFPQANGEICLAMSGGPGGCIAGFSAEIPVDSTYGRLAADEPVAVWGLAPDDVTRIQVDVDGALHEATLRNNAYFFQLPDIAMSTDDLAALVLTRRDGSTTRVPLH